jgi:excisionase family DNA binding protein
MAVPVTAPPPPPTSSPTLTVPTPSVSHFWTVRQCAERLQCGDKIIRRAIASGHLRAVRLGGRVIRVKPAWLDAWCDAAAGDE